MFDVAEFDDEYRGEYSQAGSGDESTGSGFLVLS